MQRKKDQNQPILIIGTALYCGMLAYFAFQTWEFLVWVFPDSYGAWRIVSLIFFDGMALFWAIVHTFYRFHDRNAHNLISWAWGVTFFISATASVLSLVLAGYFRYNLPVPSLVFGLSAGISIFATVYSILSCMFWLLWEWKALHPHMHYYEQEEMQADLAISNASNGNNATYGKETRVLANSGTLQLLPSGNSQKITRITRQQIAARAIIGKYGREAVLGDINRYAVEAGIDSKTLKRYATGQEETA